MSRTRIPTWSLALATLACAPETPTWSPAALVARDKEGRTLLHLAARDGDLPRVRALLAQGAKVEAKDVHEWTPLHWAGIAGHADIIEALAAEGAALEARGWYDMSPLHWSALLGRSRAVNALLVLGADPRARNLYGMTPLFEAANREVTALLLGAGARVDATDYRGMTALHVSRDSGAAEALIDAGANILTRSKSGLQPVHMSVAGDSVNPRVVAYPGRDLVRMRGDRAELRLEVRNVAVVAVEGLRMQVASKACEAQAEPPVVERLYPGQLLALRAELRRRPGVDPREHKLALTLTEAGGDQLLRFDMRLDTRRELTPEDKGMVRLGTVEARPSPRVLQYAAYLGAPLLLLLGWLWWRRKVRLRAGGP